MSLVQVHAESFANGNGGLVVMRNPDYEQEAPSPFAGDDPADPDYPFIHGAELVEVLTGAGPSGENALWWWNNPGDGGDGPQHAGIALYGIGNLSGVVDGREGKVRCFYKHKNVGSTSFRPLIVIAQNAGIGVGAQPLMLAVYPSDGTVEVTYISWDTGTELLDTETINLAADFTDVWREVILEWKCGTVVGEWDDVLPDGFVKVTMGGTVIYNVTGIDLNLHQNSESYTGRKNGFNATWFGFAGLFGELTGIQIFGFSEVEIPIDESTPCCGSSVPPGETTPGDLAPPNPYIPLPPWTSVGCEGNGTYLTASNPTEPETWTL